MRMALYQFLTSHCQTVQTWKQPFTADAKTPKPYGVIQLAEETKAPFNRLGQFQDLYIWLYFPPGSYLPLDAAVAEVKALLGEQTLVTEAGKSFFIDSGRAGRDFYDTELKALAKRVDFTIPMGG